MSPVTPGILSGVGEQADTSLKTSATVRTGNVGDYVTEAIWKQIRVVPYTTHFSRRLEETRKRTGTLSNQSLC